MGNSDMKYLSCTDYRGAEDRSRALWDAIRPPAQRSPEDITEFLLPIKGDAKSGFALAVDSVSETRIAIPDRANLTTMKPIVEDSHAVEQAVDSKNVREKDA